MDVIVAHKRDTEISAGLCSVATNVEGAKEETGEQICALCSGAVREYFLGPPSGGATASYSGTDRRDTIYNKGVVIE